MIQRAWEISQQAENAQIRRSGNARFSHMARHKHCLRLLSQQGLWPHMHCLPLVSGILDTTRKQCICIYKCEKPSIPPSRNEWFFCLFRHCPKPRLTQSFGLRLRDSHESLKNTALLLTTGLFSAHFRNIMEKSQSTDGEREQHEEDLIAGR